VWKLFSSPSQPSIQVHVQETQEPFFPISPISEVKGLDSKKKPVLGELEEALRNTWKIGTIDDFKQLAREKSSLNETENESFVEGLFDQGKIAYDPEGWLVWVK